MHNFDVQELENIIGYQFKDKLLAVMAFTHSSYANEKKSANATSYERLEFLGDSIVNMIVSQYLYENYPELPEGELTRIRAIVVCEPTFHKCSKKLELGQFLRLGKGEELTGGRERISILADVFEAVIGALYFDGGYENTQKFAIEQLKDIIINAAAGVVFMDYKTNLQELLQKNPNCKIIYETVKELGPDHNKEFIVNVKNNDEILGEGRGKSKKEAEQLAAKEALNKIKKGN